jgi:hypothetical protein
MTDLRPEGQRTCRKHVEGTVTIATYGEGSHRLDRQLIPLLSVLLLLTVLFAQPLFVSTCWCALSSSCNMQDVTSTEMSGWEEHALS